MPSTAAVATLMLAAFLGAPAVRAQEEFDWQSQAGGRMSFEVASVRRAVGEFRGPSFPLDDGDAYAATGGRFSADLGLVTYITFAYKLSLTREQRQAMIAGLPKWVSEDRFDIQAKSAVSNPTKDQMRLMMQALLAERFGLALHFETQETPVLGLVLSKPATLGPKLRSHTKGPSCDTVPGPHLFPSRCHVMELGMNGDSAKMGARDTTMSQIAGALPSAGRLPRQVVDRTGLNGRFDFTLEWAPETSNPGESAPSISRGPSFHAALGEQLGLRLESMKANLRVPVIDRVELPSEN